MERGREQFRVGVSGSYGGMNLGDEAILASIVEQMRSSLPAAITVFSRDPDDTVRRHDVDRAVPVRDLTREEAGAEVTDLDVLVLGGGGLLYDSEAETYLREVQLAQEAGVPVMVYAISAGPLAERSVREAVRERLQASSVVTVRDRHGRKVLEEIGVDRPIEVTADPALLLEPEPLASGALAGEVVDPERRLVGLSVREPGPAAPDIDVDHYHELLANAADFIVDRMEAEVVFVPMEREHRDLQHSHAVVAQMQYAQRATVLKEAYSPAQLLELFGQFEFAVGMRLHFLIFSALQCVPFIPLPYASKVEGFVEQLEMEMPVLDEVSAGSLIARIDHAWDLRHETRERIDRLLPDLRKRARRNNELLVELLSSGVRSADPAR